MPRDDQDLARAGRALRDMMTAAETFRVAAARHAGVGNSDMSAVNALARHGSLTPGALAEYLKMSTPNMTALIDRLARQSIVTRTPNPTDRRSVLVSLTDDACDQIQQVQQQIDHIVAGMPNLRAVTRVLDEVARRVDHAADDIETYLGPTRASNAQPTTDL